MIFNFRNECNSFFLEDFNARTTTNQVIILSNDFNPNSLWLDEDLVLASKYKRNSKNLVENLFGTKLIKLSNSQDLIICNGPIKWPKPN